MHVVVIGAGIIGLSSAYFLAKAGCEVTVVERDPIPAQSSSFANGAQLSYTHAEPWATLPNVWKAIKWIGQEDAPFLLRPSLDPDMWVWLTKFLLNCMPSTVKAHTLAILDLGLYSRKVLGELMREHNISMDFQDTGILHIFKTKAEVRSFEKYMQNLHTLRPELEFATLNRRKSVEIDPTIEFLMRKRSGGIFCKLDQIGDIYKYCQELDSICRKMGVQFKYGVQAHGLKARSSGEYCTAVTDHEDISGDVFLVCSGAYSGVFLQELGYKLPIYPMKGYSISVPNHAAKYDKLKISITDHQKKVVFTPLDGYLRAAGTVELNGFDHSINPSRIDPICKLTKRYFPNGGDFSMIRSWSCLRPQTPRSYPYIKRIAKNLFVNTGHGSLGWTQGPGSGKLIADIITNTNPEIDPKLYW